MSKPESMLKDTKQVPLKELGHWTGGGTPSKSKLAYWENGTIPWVSPKDMKVEQITITEDYITEAAVRESSTNLVPAGSLLMVTRSGILRHTFPVAIASVPVTINQDLKALIPKPGILSKYVAFALNSFSQDILRGCSKQGTTVNSIDTEKLLRFKIPVVSPVYQERIVAEIEKQFSRLDEAVASLMRVQANLKRYKAAVLKAAVEGKLTEQWRKDHPVVEPADQLLKRILAERRIKWEAEELAKMMAKGIKPKDDSWKKKYKEPAEPDTSNLPELPEGWVWVTLPQLGELNRGKSKHRPRNAPQLYGGPYPFVQTGDIRAANGLLRNYTQTYSEAGLGQSRLWPVGTLCITIAANIADTAILGLEACFPDSIVGFVTDQNHCEIRFIEFFIRTAKENIERYAPATAQKNINLEILSDVAAPLPPLREQKTILDEIDQRLSVTDELETTIETNLKRAGRLRQVVLQNAFSGQLLTDKIGVEQSNEWFDNIIHSKDIQDDKVSETERRRVTKVKKDNSKRPLLDVIKEYPEGITPESLLVHANYSLDEVDAFYEQLSKIRNLIEQEKPDEKSSHRWPEESLVLLKLTRN